MGDISESQCAHTTITITLVLLFNFIFSLLFSFILVIMSPAATDIYAVTTGARRTFCRPRLNIEEGIFRRHVDETASFR